eukprot:jgi/Botrbrau1/10262/Bobra.0140s0016.1
MLCASPVYRVTCGGISFHEEQPPICSVLDCGVDFDYISVALIEIQNSEVQAVQIGNLALCDPNIVRGTPFNLSHSATETALCTCAGCLIALSPTDSGVAEAITSEDVQEVQACGMTFAICCRIPMDHLACGMPCVVIAAWKHPPAVGDLRRRLQGSMRLAEAFSRYSLADIAGGGLDYSTLMSKGAMRPPGYQFMCGESRPQRPQSPYDRKPACLSSKFSKSASKNGDQESFGNADAIPITRDGLHYIPTSMSVESALSQLQQQASLRNTPLCGEIAIPPSFKKIITARGWAGSGAGKAPGRKQPCSNSSSSTGGDAVTASAPSPWDRSRSADYSQQAAHSRIAEEKNRRRSSSIFDSLYCKSDVPRHLTREPDHVQRGSLAEAMRELETFNSIPCKLLPIKVRPRPDALHMPLDPCSLERLIHMSGLPA